MPLELPPNPDETKPSLAEQIFTPKVAAQKAPHLIELERKKELLAKVKAVRDAILINRGEVLKGNQSREYCWVNRREDRQMFFQALGWTLCRDPEVQTRVPRQEDGTFVRGDLILYDIDKEYYQALCAYSELKGLEATQGYQDAFSSFSEQQGSRTFKPRI